LVLKGVVVARAASEFGGVDGMFPEENKLSPSLQQQMWAVYATNAGGPVFDEAGVPDGSELLENAPERIGYPLETYTPDSH
jgi:hypothetical protein